jgi:hypothetical protein
MVCSGTALVDKTEEKVPFVKRCGIREDNIKVNLKVGVRRMCTRIYMA